MDASGVQEVRHISFLNVRVSHQIIGCAEPVLPYLLQDGLCHTLIISPPGCGKNDAAQGPDPYNLQWQQATAWENRRCRGRTLGAGGVLPGCAAE